MQLGPYTIKPYQTGGDGIMSNEEMTSMIFNYIRATWYESKCKKPEDIQKIIKEELQKRPNYMDMKMSKLCLIIKRRCMSEL